VVDVRIMGLASLFAGFGCAVVGSFRNHVVGDEARCVGFQSLRLSARRDAPMARYYCMGLIWLLKGERVVALTATKGGCQAG
jgi:hypothetical protein